ncbi:putative bifunctional diguanylate cyclase/phosphodiesterase [Rhizobium sp. RAF56]|jgi:diguanylate cyclase (GGDEF)-like protein|uniref:putative bifunctional diguanylate cyclase/phosphodiesterase n=1 Tax=Rhizobium sp. RAF56 TaxID=3233062 RepID=UPI003F966241
MQSAEPAYFHDADSPMPVQRLMETMAQLLEHCSGELAAHTSSFEEIESENTALRQALSAAEVALTQVFEMREAVLHNLPLGLSMFDTEQRLTTCNQRFCDLFHFSEEDRKPGTPIATLLARVPGTEQPPAKPVPLAGELRKKGARIRRREWVMADGGIIESIVTVLHDGSSVSIHQDVTDERRAAERIAHIAHHDLLTGLPNRLKFREEVSAALAMLRPDEQLALAHFNLDRFKWINDTFGVSAGDDVLRQVADRLRAITGAANIFARLGSDEFAVLQIGRQQPLNMIALADQIGRELATPFCIGDSQVELTISAGIAIAPEGGTDTDRLLKNAGVALSHAKIDGRKRSLVFSPEMEARIRVRHTLEADLRKAVKDEEFELHYQPLYDLNRSRIAGFEALLRWNHPTRGRVSPLDFVPLAEEIGLISQIGRWVLVQACRDAATWPDGLKVAVNVSAIQFLNEDLPKEVMQAVTAAGFHPSRLELEITESVLMKDIDETMPTLHALKAEGIGISMDDFGTGYSSLSYLRSFPFDKIKIDKSFLNGLAEDEHAQAVMHAIIVLGRALGMRVTVEGIETEEQLGLVRSEKCHEIQGYFISPPIPASDIPPLLEKPISL